MKPLRRVLDVVRSTPLHPQWLLGRRRAPAALSAFSGRLLDVGAGDRWVEHSLPSGTHYVALDFPPTGRELYGASPNVFADARALPFSDSTFDGVVCLDVIEHVVDPRLVLAEIARVLKPGTKAWLSMPFLYPLHDAPFDFQRYTEFGLRRDIAHAGLEVTDLRGSLHSLRSAGLLLSLALAGGISSSPVPLSALLLVPGALMVVSINFFCYFLSLFWPNWSALTSGFELEVRKS